MVSIHPHESVKSQKSKDYWFKTARDNAKGIGKNMDALFVSLEDCIYRYLGIKPIIRDKLKSVQ